MIYYIRWASGKHTIAVAPSRSALLDALDESALDKVIDDGTYAVECPGTLVCFDWMPNPDNAGETWDWHGMFPYGGTDELVRACHAMDLAQMQPGHKFFAECFTEGAQEKF